MNAQISPITSESPLADALFAISSRHEMDVDALSLRVQENFSGSLITLKQIQPLIEEVLRRFKHLGRKQKVDGSYPNIAGFRKFSDWCVGVLRRNPRTIRYLIAGGNKRRTPPKVATVSSPHDAATILKTLDRNIGELSKTQQKLLTQGLAKVLSRLQETKS